LPPKQVTMSLRKRALAQLLDGGVEIA